MTTKENIDTLRKPGAQALSLISLFLILFSCLTFFFGLDYERLVKSRLLCKMLYNVFTISTYQN
ncbi:TPA: DUF5079 family protein [Staphylococcus aureus]